MKKGACITLGRYLAVACVAGIVTANPISFAQSDSDSHPASGTEQPLWEKHPGLRHDVKQLVVHSGEFLNAVTSHKKSPDALQAELSRLKSSQNMVCRSKTSVEQHRTECKQIKDNLDKAQAELKGQ